jgi:mannitol/fructose-specific phosphotransferase system IIA component (Ntr-type)
MVVVSMSNKNFDEIINNIKSKKSNDEAQEYLKNNLSAEQNRKLKEILSDKNALEKLLSTPKAQELLKKFTEGKND